MKTRQIRKMTPKIGQQIQRGDLLIQNFLSFFASFRVLSRALLSLIKARWIPGGSKHHSPTIHPCTSAAVIPAVDPGTAAATAIHPAATASPSSPAIDPSAAPPSTPPIHPDAGAGLGRRCEPSASKYHRRDCRTRPFPHALEERPSPQQLLIGACCVYGWFIIHNNKLSGRYCVPLAPASGPPVSVEKCIAAISHFSSFFATVRDIFRGNAKSFPPFLPVTFPAVIIQPICGDTPPILNWYSNFCSPLSKPSKKCS